MAFTKLLIHTVGIAKRTTGTTDRYGNETIVFLPPVDVIGRMEQLAMGSQRAKEILDNRDTRITWFRLFLDPDVDISSLDRVVWEGRTFEVDANPVVWPGRHGPHHITAVLKEIDD